MSATAPSPSPTPPSTEAGVYAALRDSCEAALVIPELLESLQATPHAGPDAQHRAIETWAATYLREKNAPAELVQDCVKWLQTTASSSPAVNSDERNGADRRGRSDSFSSPWHQYQEQRQQLYAGSPAYDPSTLNGGGGVDNNGNSGPTIALDASLDDNHCSIARMIADEERLWQSWEALRLAPSSGNGYDGGGNNNNSRNAEWRGLQYEVAEQADAYEDVFSDATLQREGWQCWAAVLRDVKIEAAVQQQERHSRQSTRAQAASQSTLDGLLDYLDVPETRWLLQDAPSSMLLSADIAMKDRAYATAQSEAHLSTDEDDGASPSESRKAMCGTHDMKALHEYLLQQDPQEPTLRSLLLLTLDSHLRDERQA